MNTDYTHLTLVIDRSGSMQNLAVEATGGINTLINEQFTEEGKFSITLVEFDERIETVMRLSNEATAYTLVPRGMTALYDAVGGEIARTREDLAKLPEEERPSTVIFVIVTDGHENASREYQLPRIRDMIKDAETDGWVFQFLGAGPAAFQGQSMGVAFTEFDPDSASVDSSYRYMNDRLKRTRRSKDVRDFLMPNKIDKDFFFEEED